MASTKKDANTEAASFDYKNFLPPGAQEADLRTIGGLTPIYAPGDAYDGKWPPVAGWMDRLVQLPDVQQGKNEDGSVRVYQPLMIRVVLEHPTRGLKGTGDKKEEVELAKGDDILVPVTGQLRANSELMLTLEDGKKIHFGIFRVTGKEKVNNQPTPMWVIHSQLVAGAAGSKERAGRFALPAGVSVQPLKIAATADGSNYDMATGEMAHTPSAQASA